MRRPIYIAIGWMFLFTTIASAQDRLPDGAALRIGVHRLRVAGTIADYVFTPDQRTLVVAYEENDPKKFNVVLFDVGTGLERKRLHVRGARHLAMAAHKPMLALDTDNGIEAWDLAAGKRVQQWDYPECVDEASALTISPDGVQVVAAMPMLLRWNVESGAALPAFQPRRSAFPIHKLQYSADGSELFSAESPPRLDRRYRDYLGLGPEFQLLMFEYANYYLLPLTTYAGPRTRLLHTTAWSIGANWVVRPPAPHAAVWDAATGKKLREFSIGEGDCAFAPDGTMIALSGTSMYSFNRTDIVRLDRDWTHVGSIDSAGSVAFSPDSARLLINGNLLWDIAGRKELMREVAAPDAASMRFSPDGKLLALVKSDNERSGRYSKYRYSEPFPPRTSADGNHLQLVDVATGKPKSWATGYADAVGGVTYSPDGRWLASHSGDTIYIHDAKTGAELRRWIAHKQPITQIAFSPDGKTLASGSQAVLEIRISPDGKTPVWNSSIGLWDPATGKEGQRLAYDNHVDSLAFSRDGTALISIGRNAPVRRWNIGTAKHEDLGNASARAAVSADQLAYFQTQSETGAVNLQWQSLRAGKKLSAGPVGYIVRERGATTEEGSLVFSADGKLLASSGLLPEGEDKSEQTVRIWESASQREIARFTRVLTTSQLLAISPDGRLLAHGGELPQKSAPNVNKSSPLFRDEEYFGRSRANNSAMAVMIRDLASERSGDTKNTRSISGHLGAITCLAFSPDGKFLATGGADQVVYVWRVEHFFKRPAMPDFKGVVADLWPHLADADAGKGYRAIAQLERQPKETVALLRKHLKPAQVAEEKIIIQHLRELASGNFAVRQQANISLEKLGEQATPHVLAALKKPVNLEAKRRLEELLVKLERPMDVADNLRAYRCLVLLERIGTPESRQLLDDLSRGAPTAWLTVEAKHSVQRVSR